MGLKYWKWCLVIVICLFSDPVLAQEEHASFEEIHSDKAYIVELIEDEVKVNADWSFKHKVHKKFKIIKEEAKDMGEIPINYDRDLDRITDQEIFTITPDGKKHPPIKTQDMAVYEGEPMYSNAMVRVLSMPAVGVGVTIDLAYTILSKGMAMKDAFWTIRTVSFEVPVKEYRYTITFPKKLGITYREFGLTQKPEVIEKNGWITYRWVLNELYDHTQGEEYVPPPSPDDPSEAFEFSSVKSWDDLAGWYAGLIHKNSIATPEIVTAAKTAVGDATLTRDKVRAVLEYVQDRFRYVSMSFGENAFEPHLTKEVFANKYGDCKDLSLLTRVMLEAVGVKAHIALFNTEDEINDPSYDLPIPALFNHVLLLVEDPVGGDFYADPLLKGYDIGQYPMAFQRAYTFVIADGKGRFGRFPEFDAERMSERSNQVIDMHEDWSGVYDLSRVWNLDASMRIRNSLKMMNDTERREFYEQLDLSLAQGGEVIKRETEGLEKRYGRMRSTVVCRRPDEFPSADGLIIVDLQSFSRDEAFQKKERREDFFFPMNAIIESEDIYRTPAGFEIFYVPADLNLESPHLSFSRTFKRVPLGVTVKETSRSKRITLKKEALAELRAFDAELSRQTRQRLVFRRKP